jgi:hypothetical protein
MIEEGRKGSASEPVVCFVDSIMFLGVTSSTPPGGYTSETPLTLNPEGKGRPFVAEIDGLFPVY